METKKDREFVDSTIKLIEEGKTYKKMWEELYEIASEFNFFPLMDKIKQKYFPKGEQAQ